MSVAETSPRRRSACGPIRELPLDATVATQSTGAVNVAVVRVPPNSCLGSRCGRLLARRIRPHAVATPDLARGRTISCPVERYHPADRLDRAARTERPDRHRRDLC